MELYRYTYKEKQFSISKFECIKQNDKNKIPCYILTEGKREYGKKIYPVVLNRLIDDNNYVMWSLNKHALSQFKNLVLERKEKMLRKKMEEYKLLEDEIYSLNNRGL
jgi:hypothetical protein